MNHLLQSLTIPDIWQQEAVRALRGGQDVVVHAPTGAGKTYIFELLYPHLKGQAVFTVPTRALANDKLAEWRARGWDVGIATGDVAEHLDAKVVVATLETQKGRFLKRQGPSVLVIDEYQMIGDPVRGVNYELAIALAPKETQILLLSGSVANPHDVVTWMRRIGRPATLISHTERPVPLEEVDLPSLPNRAGPNVKGWWARVVFNAVMADLGPILLFAPRRNAAEDLAVQLAAAMPSTDPLRLTLEQEHLAGARLAKLLRTRVAFHHSGLSYAQRAGLVEPLAKRGELRAVVATMGLAAGINFSMRSVAITGTRYMAGQFERSVQPDELLQMYGRAGRRGLDESGFALITEQGPRLLDARAKHLRRPDHVDWPTLVAVMNGAAEISGSTTEEVPETFRAARDLNERLFTANRVPLGVEHSIETGAMPCGLWVDMERARFARRGAVEIWSSEQRWEPKPEQTVEAAVGETWIWQPAKPKQANAESEEQVPNEALPSGRWRPNLASIADLPSGGIGNPILLPNPDRKIYGRELILGTRRMDGTLALSPALKKKLGLVRLDSASIERVIFAKLREITGGDLARVFVRGEQLVVHVTFDRLLTTGYRDRAGRVLVAPPEKRVLPEPCRGCEFRTEAALKHATPGQKCPQLDWCLSVPINASPAFSWRSLGLIERDGIPTRRGVLFSFFQHGEGLAIAAALEQPDYKIEDLVFDLANLRAGPRFAGDDSPYSGRLAIACQQAFSRAELAGYLEMGVPLDYGSGASEVIRGIIEHNVPRQKSLNESLRPGDLERAIVEWKSVLRHIAYAPDYPWDRWAELKRGAARMLERVTTG